MSDSPKSDTTSNGEVAVAQNAPVQGNQNEQQPQQQQQPPSKFESFISIAKSLIVRALIIYFISSLFRGQKAPANTPGTDVKGQPTAARNIFVDGTELNLYVYLSEKDTLQNYSHANLFWFKDVVYGDWNGGPNGDGIYEVEKDIPITDSMKNNGSLFMHAFVTRRGESPDPKADNYAKEQQSKFVKQLNRAPPAALHYDVIGAKFKLGRVSTLLQILVLLTTTGVGRLTPQDDSVYFLLVSAYFVMSCFQDGGHVDDVRYTYFLIAFSAEYRKLKSSGTKNLLTGETGQEVVEEGKIISHWHPNFTINLIADQTMWSFGAVPAPVDQYIQFTDDHKFYKPILFPNDFWNMARDYKPLNETFQLKLTFQPLSMFKWQLYAAQQMRNTMFNIWGDSEPQQSDDEQDTIKETLMDTNPYLLGITIAVSILHSIFELLAFKNDIQFWNNRNSLEGLSVRSVFFSVFQSLIVLLYVLDNETNTMVKISCFVGLGIELWKIWKVVDIKFENNWISFKDKGSYIESSTRVYDQLAFKYLSWLCFPLLAGYSVYALLYLEHKGWYSFVLDLLYGYLLTFGFIMMTPQLFINYKLKSVAHLPWRMLTYKFLNTFIDDMFAFVIKMPTMYRIGCFRDDIIFLIFLYQKWIYPVDKTRMNEFGYAAEQKEDVKSIENTKELEETKKSQ